MDYNLHPNMCSIHTVEIYTIMYTLIKVAWNNHLDVQLLQHDLTQYPEAKAPICENEPTRLDTKA